MIHLLHRQARVNGRHDACVGFGCQVGWELTEESGVEVFVARINAEADDGAVVAFLVYVDEVQFDFRADVGDEVFAWGVRVPAVEVAVGYSGQLCIVWVVQLRVGLTPSRSDRLARMSLMAAWYSRFRDDAA